MRKLRQEFSQSERRRKNPAPQPFCQDAAVLSGGILSWPRPGVARRDNRLDVASLRLRRAAVRLDA